VTVYVDRLQPGRVKGQRAEKWCHMIADTLDELHAMADAIGHRREWFQASPPASFPHYDMVASRRERAVRLGAIELGRYDFVMTMRRIRASAKDRS
jgi:hypothetical protein